MAAAVTEERLEDGRIKRVFEIGPKSSPSAAAAGIAGFQRALDQVAAEARGGEGNWFDDVEVLFPLASAQVTINGHQLEIKNPKTGVWLSALPELQKALTKAHEAQAGETPLHAVLGLLRNWNAADLVAALGDSVCSILDKFLGKEPGWTAQNTEPQEIVEIVAAFLRVVPVRQYERFFREAVGAVKGHRAPAAGKPE